MTIGGGRLFTVAVPLKKVTFLSHDSLLNIRLYRRLHVLRVYVEVGTRGDCWTLDLAANLDFSQ